MLDRASSLQDPVVLKYLATRFVPAAVDQHIHRTLKDAEGELFARVLKQAGRGLGGTSQGNYLFTPDGKLLAFANTADAAHVRRLMETALKKFDPATAPAVEAGPKAALPQFEPPAGGLVLDVTSKVLGGYEKGGNRAMRDAVGRDHLWLRKDEAEALARGELPESVKQRLARFHLIDNTRGEPPLWRPDEVKRLELTLKDGRLSGSVHLETKAGNRGRETSRAARRRAGSRSPSPSPCRQARPPPTASCPAPPGATSRATCAKSRCAILPHKPEAPAKDHRAPSLALQACGARSHTLIERRCTTGACRCE